MGAEPHGNLEEFRAKSHEGANSSPPRIGDGDRDGALMAGGQVPLLQLLRLGVRDLTALEIVVDVVVGDPQLRLIQLARVLIQQVRRRGLGVEGLGAPDA